MYIMSIMHPMKMFNFVLPYYSNNTYAVICNFQVIYFDVEKTHSYYLNLFDVLTISIKIIICIIYLIYSSQKVLA